MWGEVTANMKLEKDPPKLHMTCWVQLSCTSLELTWGSRDFVTDYHAEGSLVVCTGLG